MAQLSDCSLFTGLPNKELREISSMFKDVRHPAGKQVIEAGRGGVGFMVILEGTAVVELKSGPLKLGPGDFFGEMAVLDHEGRSATITAETDLVLASMPEWSFKTMLTGHPEVAYRLLQVISRRVRSVAAG